MSDDAAAKKWVDANPDKVKAWLAERLIELSTGGA